MSGASQSHGGAVVSLWRYPVKSMMGEQLDAAEVTQRGLLGDRAYALMDVASGKVISAKNPKRWPDLFNFQAAFSAPPQSCEDLPPVRITLPDGTIVASGQSGLDRILSEVLKRQVTLESTPPPQPCLEEYWPDIEDLDHRDTITDEPIPPGAFFDGAAVHLLTTATLAALQKQYPDARFPDARFDARRFRPNLVIDPGPGEEGFVEDTWIGRTLAVGPQVRLSIERPCPRCVMTTLAQGDLPADPDVLRAAVRQHHGHVGVYAAVLHGGVVRRGDPVILK